MRNPFREAAGRLPKPLTSYLSRRLILFLSIAIVGAILLTAAEILTKVH